MRISIFGLGYVGAVTAGCLAQQGHSIVGVDVHPQKVDLLNRGEAPIIEPGLPELLKIAKEKSVLRATQSAEDAVAQTELSLICVGTPSSPTGALDLRFVNEVTQQIARTIERKAQKHTIVFRSTMLPGSTTKIVSEILSSLMEAGLLSVFYYPEFLREGTAVDDFFHPSLVIVGSKDGLTPSAELSRLFGPDAAVLDWGSAEMVKYACNAFHATKIVFANEIGRLSKHLQIDARAVMSLLCRDTKLNLSPYYLRPGNPFGGSCLPKDVRALNHCGRQAGVSLPLLDNLIGSNEQHLRLLLQLIDRLGPMKVSILGLSFKSDTDDLRESAMVEIAQNLLGRGYELRIYDPQLNLAQLVGSNKRVIDLKMPHLASLLHSDLSAALGDEGLIIAAQRCASIEQLANHVTARHQILDVNGWPELRGLAARYEGFCW